MFKPSIAVHKNPDGKLKVLACSEDVDEIIAAYKACQEPGEVGMATLVDMRPSKKPQRESARAGRRKAPAKSAGKRSGG